MNHSQTLSDFLHKKGNSIAKNVVLIFCLFLFIFNLFIIIHSYRQKASTVARALSSYIVQQIKISDILELTRQLNSLLKSNDFVAYWLLDAHKKEILAKGSLVEEITYNQSRKFKFIVLESMQVIFFTRHKIQDKDETLGNLILATSLPITPFFLGLVLALLFLYCFFEFMHYRISETARRITRPINLFSSFLQNMHSTKSLNPPSDDELVYEELKDVKKRFLNLYQMLKKSEEMAKVAVQEQTLARVARQVAHDILSPLSALGMMSELTKELSEENRIFLRRAIQRIKDIANNLIGQSRQYQYNQKNVNDSSDFDQCEIMTTEFITPVIDEIISEKRMEYKEKIKINLESKAGENAYSAFARVQVSAFKRVLSNIINNSIEAIDNNGVIIVGITKDKDGIQIQVSDNGQGIPPEILNELFSKEVTYGKDRGQGLGLIHAKKNLEMWGGKISLHSELNQGTKVKITLPVAEPPSWFFSELMIKENMKIVIIDDDHSIHDMWDKKIRLATNIKSKFQMLHFFRIKDFELWLLKNQNLENHLFLVDYEFLGEKMSGMDLIDLYGLASQSILVTSKYDDMKIKKCCIEMKLGLIPKDLVRLLPLKDERESKKKKENVDLVDAILIDDDALVIELWKMRAKQMNKNILTYQYPENFIKNYKNIPFDTPIYIDSHLADDQRGEEIAKEFYQLGFHSIYLETGYDMSSSQNLHWIKGITGKRPPW